MKEEDKTYFSKGYCSIFWGNYRKSARVKRDWKLKMFEDEYDYQMLRNAQVIKEYSGSCEMKFSRILKDDYGRMWLHVYYSDSYEDREEETFDFVESEIQADQYQNNDGRHYYGHKHYFFASEQPDFILHERTEEKEGDAEIYYNEICKLNGIKN